MDEAVILVAVLAWCGFGVVYVLQGKKDEDEIPWWKILVGGPLIWLATAGVMAARIRIEISRRK